MWLIPFNQYVLPAGVYNQCFYANEAERRLARHIVKRGLVFMDATLVPTARSTFLSP